jgi:PAS domain S-box-containing protein
MNTFADSHNQICTHTPEDTIVRALRASEEHFRSIIENVSDVITIIEPDGTVSYATPSIQTLLGYAPLELHGRPIFDFVHPNDVRHATEFFGHLSPGASPADAIELRFCHADGSLRIVEVVARIVMRGNHVTGTIATARDITERRKLQTQLQTANRLASLGRLAATVAHEFNNVLMSMQPFAELLQRPSPKPEMVLKSARHIAHSIGRGKQIAQDILRFTQPAEPALVPIRIDQWWSVLYPELAMLIADNIEIATDFSDPSLHILADASQLAQVFVNLLTNARDAMPAGGKITISARRPAPGATYPFGIVDDPRSFIHLSVSDTGCGIPPEMLRHIFEPLFTSKQTGTGLGLAVTRHVVERHNGRIFVESARGRGTTFHIFLPAAEPAIAQKEAARQRPQIRSRRLLMVEDEPAIVEGLAALLGDAHVEVSSVATGEEAVAAVQAFNPDVVLLDFGLPGINGVETCRRIRNERPDMAVIFSSGHGTEKQLATGLDDRRTRYLQKPFEIAALLDAIASVEAAL